MENRKYIREMQATNDGIIYFSEEPNKACLTSLNADGKIERTLLLIETTPIITPIIPKEEIEKKFSYFLTLVIDLFLITLAAYFKNIPLFFASSFFSLFVSLPLFKLINMIFRMKITKENIKAAKYIAASHMATNAYNELGRIPTLEEVKKYSRFSKNCNIIWTFMGITFNLIFWTFLSFCKLVPFILCVLICLVIMFGVPFIFLRGYLNFLQIFVTSKPSDEELIVAIEGIRSYEEMEKNVKVTIHD